VDSSVLGPSYRAGLLRARVLDELRSLEESTGTHSVALGQLGPPELSKLLWETELLALGYGTLPAVLAASPEEISATTARLLEVRPGLRDTITSLGLPILHGDGETLDRGPFIRIPEVPGGDALPVTAEDRDRWAAKGWVDLRAENFATWQRRLRTIREARPGKAQPGSAGVTPETTIKEAIETGTLAAWVLATEMGGYRIK
jgi:hypothetical protein